MQQTGQGEKSEGKRNMMSGKRKEGICGARAWRDKGIVTVKAVVRGRKLGIELSELR